MSRDDLRRPLPLAQARPAGTRRRGNTVSVSRCRQASRSTAAPAACTGSPVTTRSMTCAANSRAASTLYGPDLPGIRLVAVADAYPGLAEQTAARFGYARGETDWKAIAGADDIDVVSIVVANHLHREMAEGLLAAMTLHAQGRLPGVWVVMSEYSPEPGTTDAAAECHAVALALRPAIAAGARMRLTFAVGDARTMTVAELAERLTGESTTWSCSA